MSYDISAAFRKTIIHNFSFREFKKFYDENKNKSIWGIYSIINDELDKHYQLDLNSLKITDTISYEDLDISKINKTNTDFELKIPERGITLYCSETVSGRFANFDVFELKKIELLLNRKGFVYDFRYNGNKLDLDIDKYSGTTFGGKMEYHYGGKTYIEPKDVARASNIEPECSECKSTDIKVIVDFMDNLGTETVQCKNCGFQWTNLNPLKASPDLTGDII